MRFKTSPLRTDNVAVSVLTTPIEEITKVRKEII